MKRWMIGLIILLFLFGCNAESEQVPVLTSTPNQPPPTLTSAPATRSAPTEPVAIIYDDDGSLDGTVALLYLLSHPLADIKAINVSYGEAHPEIYIQHLGRQLDAFGMADIPLGQGQSIPMAGNNAFPEFLRQMSNNYWGIPVPNPESTYWVERADALITYTINESPTPVTIFMTGTATNLAAALRMDKGIKKNIEAVYIMGGAIYVPGNITALLPDSSNQVAEWNIFADPVAAKEVFESGLQIYLVPLDATNQISVTQMDIDLWRQGGELAQLSADFYQKRLNDTNAIEAEIWDLMTAPLIFEPALCKFQPLHLQVITEEGIKTGQTAVITGEPSNAQVCLEPDVDGILQNLARVLTSKAK